MNPKDILKSATIVVLEESEMKETAIVLKRLDRIQAELAFIKEHMVDADVLLTAGERRLLDESIQNEQEGRLVPLEAIRRVRRKTR